MLQHTLVTPTTLKCPELARWARLIACGGDMSPVGPLDDAAPSTAHTSLPCQKTPADLGIPGKFVGRTSLVARRGGARPPFFFTRGPHRPPQILSPEVRDGGRHRATEKRLGQPHILLKSLIHGGLIHKPTVVKGGALGKQSQVQPRWLSA